MLNLKSTLILSATAVLLSATPAMAQYGSGSGGSSAASVAQPSVATPAASQRVSQRALKGQQDAWSKKEELEKMIAIQEAQAAEYSSATKAADQDTADKAYGSGTEGAQKVEAAAQGSGTEGAQDAADKAYGSGAEGAQKVKGAAHGSGTEGAQDAASKAHGSATEGAQKAQGAAYGSDTDAAQKAKAYGSSDNGAKVMQEKAYGSGTEAAPATNLPVNCPSGTTAQPNGTCLLTGT